MTKISSQETLKNLLFLSSKICFPEDINTLLKIILPHGIGNYILVQKPRSIPKRCAGV